MRIRVALRNFVIFFFAVLVGESFALGATVLYVGSQFAIIDAGRDHGLSTGDRVCFFENGINLVGCGHVKVLRKRLSGIHLESDLNKSIAVWMAVRGNTLREVPEAATPTQREIGKIVKAFQGADNDLSKKEESKPEDGRAKTARREVSLSYLVTPVNPFLLNIPTYSLSNEIENSGPLWKRERLVSMSPLGFQVMGMVPVGNHWSGALGALYRWVPHDRIIVPYDVSDATIGAKGKTQARSMGIFAGAVRWWGSLKGIGWYAGGGLGGDYSQVSHELTLYGTEEAATIAKVDSHLLGWALRADTGLHIPLGPVFFKWDLGLQLPLLGKAQSKVNVSGLRPSLNQELKDQAPSDLVQALHHVRGPFSVQVAFGIGGQF